MPPPALPTLLPRSSFQKNTSEQQRLLLAAAAAAVFPDYHWTETALQSVCDLVQRQRIVCRTGQRVMCGYP